MILVSPKPLRMMGKLLLLPIVAHVAQDVVRVDQQVVDSLFIDLYIREDRHTQRLGEQSNAVSAHLQSPF